MNKTVFKYNAPFTRVELIRRARKAAQAVMRSVILLDVNRKKHETDDLLLLFYEDWFPKIMNLSTKGMKACPLEFNLFTESITFSVEEQETRKGELEQRIRDFFFESGFSILRFESWKLEKDLIGVMFYVSWR